MFAARGVKGKAHRVEQTIAETSAFLCSVLRPIRGVDTGHGLCLLKQFCFFFSCVQLSACRVGLADCAAFGTS